MQCLALHNQTLAQNATLMQQAMNDPDLIRSVMDCTVGALHLAMTDPTGTHLLAAMPAVAGLFMVTNSGVRTLRLWGWEIYNYLRRR